MVNAAGICSMKAENTLPPEDNESLNSTQKSVYAGENAEQWLRATSPPVQAHSSPVLGMEGILVWVVIYFPFIHIQMIYNVT